MTSPDPIKHRTQSFYKAGFYYTNNKDIVQCCICNIQISDWSQSHDPINRHFIYSPTCPFISILNRQNTKRPKCPLHGVVDKPKGKLYPQHYFQAVSRLAHYVSKPNTNYNDQILDEGAIEQWQLILHPNLKIAYQDVRRRINLDRKIFPKIELRTIPHSKTPFQWFIRQQQVQYFRKYGQLAKQTVIKKLEPKWHKLSPQQKHLFEEIAQMDDTRYRAERIEARFANNGTFIGFTKPSKTNIIVCPFSETGIRRTISQVLLQHIQKKSTPV